jgi:hypothetical protein
VLHVVAYCSVDAGRQYRLLREHPTRVQLVGGGPTAGLRSKAANKGMVAAISAKYLISL